MLPNRNLSSKLPRAHEVIFSPTANTAAFVGRCLHVFDASSWERKFKTHPLPNISHAQFSPSGEALAVKNTSGAIAVVDSMSGDLRVIYPAGRMGEGCNAVFTACEKYLVDGSWGGALTVRSSNKNQLMSRVISDGEMITQVAHAIGSQKWLTIQQPTIRDGESFPRAPYVAIWEWPLTAAPSKRIAFGEAIFLRGLTVLPDGCHFVVSCGWRERSEIAVCRLSNGKIVHKIPQKTFSLALSCSLDGKYIASTAPDDVHIYCCSSFELVATYSISGAIATFAVNSAFVVLASGGKCIFEPLPAT